MVPRGFRFNPTDEELVQILQQKASGQEMASAFVVEANVYDIEPQDLEWNQRAGMSNGERYYYCKKESDSREVAGRGWWKATSHLKKVYSGEQLVGCKRPLTFHRFKDSNQRSRNNATKTNWIMHEYSLETKSTKWRLCKIKHKGKPSDLQEEMENLRHQRPLQNDLEAGSSNTSTQPSDDVSDQPSTMPLDGGYQPSRSEWDMEYQPQYLYDVNGDYCYHHHHHYHHLVDRQEHGDPTEQLFHGLWSWQN